MHGLDDGGGRPHGARLLQEGTRAAAVAARWRPGNDTRRRGASGSSDGNDQRVPPPGGGGESREGGRGASGQAWSRQNVQVGAGALVSRAEGVPRTDAAVTGGQVAATATAARENEAASTGEGGRGRGDTPGSRQPARRARKDKKRASPPQYGRRPPAPPPKKRPCHPSSVRVRVSQCRVPPSLVPRRRRQRTVTPLAPPPLPAGLPPSPPHPGTPPPPPRPSIVKGR